MSESIDKLTAAMAAGDKRAIETFYRRYFNWLYAQARRYTRRDESFCLDVVQEAVIKIIRNVRAVQHEGQLLAWLKLVIQSTSLDLLRREQRRKNHETSRPQMDTRKSDEHLQWLQKQIETLDPTLVQVINMRYQQGFKLQKIADYFGVSVGAIDGRLRRAVRTLRDRGADTDHG